MNYYNEIDPYAAQWLRNLISRGLIPGGEVDERSIVDVRADDLRGFTQCHFFAGIGGWPYALKLAGWADDREVWTGSCPCQPFSNAGQQKGFNDERHLWPAFYKLIAERHPAVVFGEQVASKLGREWLAGIRADLEGMAYAVGAADLCAAGVGAPHIRQRLYWLGVADSAGRIEGRQAAPPVGYGRPVEPTSDTGGLAHADQGERGRLADGGGCEFDRTPTGRQQGDGKFEPGGDAGRLGDASGARPQERGSDGRVQQRQVGAPQGQAAKRTGADSFWSGAEWLTCSDGKARRAQPGIFPLAARLSGRVAVGSAVQQAASEEAAHEVSAVGVLRGAGNAIVPQVAAAFIAAFMETQND